MPHVQYFRKSSSEANQLFNKSFHKFVSLGFYIYGVDLFCRLVWILIEYTFFKLKYHLKIILLINLYFFRSKLHDEDSITGPYLRFKKGITRAMICYSLHSVVVSNKYPVLKKRVPSLLGESLLLTLILLIAYRFVSNTLILYIDIYLPLLYF